MNRVSLHTRSFRRIHLSVFRHRLIENGLAGPKSIREFEKWVDSGAHYPERAISLFSYNGVFTSRVIFRYSFPAKFTVSGYGRIKIWVKTMLAKLCCFCYCILFFTCRFPSFQSSFLKLVFPQFPAVFFHFPHLQVKQRHIFDTFLSVRVRSIESTLCKFFSRLCNGQGDF